MSGRVECQGKEVEMWVWVVQTRIWLIGSENIPAPTQGLLIEKVSVCHPSVSHPESWEQHLLHPGVPLTG